MRRHRVVVTGIGVVTPLGIGVAAFWDGVLSERSAVGPVTRFPTDGYATRIAAQVDGFDPGAFMSAKRLRWTDRFSQLAIAAARLACDDAAFTPPAEETGLWIGSALGGLAYADEQHDVFRTEGIDAVRPLLALSVFGGAAACNVAIELGVRGPSVGNANSCASGATAIGEAMRAVARGDVRVALAGGAEAPLAPLVYGAFTVIGAMSTRNEDPARASRPFDAQRDGFVMAEGAAVLVLEREEDARARGARIYGEAAGFGLTTDAYHLTAPLPDGAMNAAAMRRALAEAGVASDEVDAVNAHGSATPRGDAAEAVAIASVFGERAVPVSATKGQHGHALGATGAWEAAITLLSLVHGVLPRTVNADAVDPPELAVTRAPMRSAPRVVLSNAAGFGGINAALVFRAASG